MDYNLIAFIVMGLAIFLLLVLLIVRRGNRRNMEEYYSDEVSEPMADSQPQSGEVTGATIWSGTLIDCEVKDNSYLSNVFLRDVPGAQEIQVQSNVGKFQFK